MAVINNTLGSGADYADIGTALAAIIAAGVHMTDDYVLTVATPFTENTGVGSPFIYYDGHYIEIRNPNKHTITVAGAGTGGLKSLRFQSVSSSVNDRMYFNDLIFDIPFINPGASFSFLYFCPGSQHAYVSAFYNNCVFLCNGYEHTAAARESALIGLEGAASLQWSNASISNCKFYNYGTATGSARIGANQIVTLEFCTGYNCYRGLTHSDAIPATVQYNVRSTVFAESASEDYYSYLSTLANINFINCADSDNTLITAGGDLTDCKHDIVAVDEFQSLDGSSTEFLKLKNGVDNGGVYAPGSLNLGIYGAAPTIPDANTDLDGNARPGVDGYYSIGAYEQQYFTCHEEADGSHEANIRKFHSKIEVTWTDSFIDNTTAATANDTNRIHDVTNLISQTMDGVTAVPRRWAHLDDTIVADGTFFPMPGTTLLAATNQVGWWGKEECNSDGEWIQATTTTTTTMTPSQHPTLTTTFASRPIYTLLVCGDNIYGEYPRSFEIKVYTLSTDTVPVYTDSVTDDVGSGWTLSNVNAGDAQAVKWDKTLTTSIDLCQKIELIIKKWNVGLRVVKISEFYTAITETYTDDDILSMKLLEESEIADGSLPVGNISSNELDIKLQNIENRFFWGNTDSPLHNLIKINRRIRAWIGIELADDSIYYVLLGTFFSGDWDAQELGTDVSTAARDRMELLRKADYETSPLNENITLYDLAVLVLDDAKTKITDLEYNISTDLQNYTLPYGWFEKQSYFKCLKQIAGACMGRAYMDRDDVLQIDTDL